MVQELQGTPVTVKIRVLESGPEATVEFAKMLEACGASAVCVHGRTVHQNKQLCGASNGDVARQVLLLHVPKSMWMLLAIARIFPRILSRGLLF